MAEPSDEEFLGIVQVPLSRLCFRSDLGGRGYDPEHGRYLSQLFSDTSIDHEDCSHHVKGYVDWGDVPSVLEELGLSRRQLQETALNESYPRLENRTIVYPHGRHRIEAAKIIDPSSLWTVKLYSAGLDAIDQNKSARMEAEQYKHEKKYSDGHIYHKIREYTAENDLRSVRIWRGRLSPWRRVCFDMIQDRPTLSEPLDTLKDFAGIIEELQLCSYPKGFRLHLENEIARCLQRTLSRLSELVGDSDAIRRCFDIETMRILEGRAPMASEFDRRLIRKAFEDRRAFKGVTDLQQRLDIERRACMTTGMIPSIRWLQENMKYLRIAAQIIWTHLVPEELKKMAKKMTRTADKKGRRVVIPLSTLLRQCWDQSARPLVEISEGVFQPVLGPPSFELVYNQLVLVALRQFPGLSGEDPLIDHAPPINSEFHPRYLYRGARLLGLRNRLIEQGVSAPAPPRSSNRRMDDSEGRWSDCCSATDGSMNGYNRGRPEKEDLLNRVDRRWGRPHRSTFLKIQEVAFLPQLMECPQNSSEISVSFIMRDFVQAFLGLGMFELDFSQQCVSINSSLTTRTSGDPVRALLNPTAYSVLLPTIWEDPLQAYVDSDVMMEDAQPSPDFDVVMEDSQPPPSVGDQIAASDMRGLDVGTCGIGACESAPTASFGSAAHLSWTPSETSRQHLSSISTPRTLPIDSFAGQSGTPVERSEGTARSSLCGRNSGRPRSTLPTPNYSFWANSTSVPSWPSAADGAARLSFSGMSSEHRSTLPTPQHSLLLASSASIPSWSSGSTRQHIPDSGNPFRNAEHMVDRFSTSGSYKQPRSTISTPPDFTSPPLPVSFPSFSSALPSGGYASGGYANTSHRGDTHDVATFSMDGSPRFARSTFPTPSSFSYSHPSDSAFPSAQGSLEQGSGHFSIQGSSRPRSTCPTPPSFQDVPFNMDTMGTPPPPSFPSPSGLWRIMRDKAAGLVPPPSNETRRRPPSGWQGFDDSDDDMASVSL